MQIDNEAKIEGRGAYICRNEECVRKALKQKMVERALKNGMPEEIAETLRAMGGRENERKKSPIRN